MSDIDATTLLPTDRMRRAALAGDVTRIHRGSAHAEVGDTVEIEGTTFTVTAVEERRLGDLTDDDVRATLRGSPPARRAGCERFNPRSREPGSMVQWDWFFAVGMGAVLLLILLGLVVSFL